MIIKTKTATANLPGTTTKRQKRRGVWIDHLLGSVLDVCPPRGQLNDGDRLIVRKINVSPLSLSTEVKNGITSSDVLITRYLSSAPECV